MHDPCFDQPPVIVDDNPRTMFMSGVMRLLLDSGLAEDSDVDLAIRCGLRAETVAAIRAELGFGDTSRPIGPRSEKVRSEPEVLERTGPKVRRREKVRLTEATDHPLASKGNGRRRVMIVEGAG